MTVKLTPRQRLIMERELAAAKADASFEVLQADYPIQHNARRDAFVRTESEKVGIELEKKFEDALPDAEKDRRR